VNDHAPAPVEREVGPVPLTLLASIGDRLRGRTPSMVEPAPSRAAVAVVLAPADDDLRLLLIRRAERENDPWSGQMAFPGGRHDAASDASIEATAIRETLEEVGIDLSDAQLLARLDDVQAHARGKAVGLVVTPFLFALERPRSTAIDPREVAEAIWIPFEVFRDERFHGTTHVSRYGLAADFPAFLYEGNTVWGMTYRMIQDFLRALEEAASGEAR
jgi:8-oxo-dGTP pyrophosphatase MutT (NUDIX family)